MPRHTLYAYVEGRNHAAIYDIVESRAADLIRQGNWNFGKPWFVDQYSTDGEYRELGLNFHLPDPPLEPPGWFQDVERIAIFCAEMSVQTGKSFVIGIADHERGITQDLHFINGPEADLDRLRKIIGVA